MPLDYFSCYVSQICLKVSLSTLYFCCTYVVVASLCIKHVNPILFLKRTGTPDRGEKGVVQIIIMPFGEWKGDEGESKFGEAKAEEHKVWLLLEALLYHMFGYFYAESTRLVPSNSMIDACLT